MTEQPTGQEVSFTDVCAQHNIDPESARSLFKIFLSEADDDGGSDEAIMHFAEKCFIAGLQSSNEGSDTAQITASLAMDEVGLGLIYALANAQPITIRLDPV